MWHKFSLRLKKVYGVNSDEVYKVVDKNSEPQVVCHGKNEFVKDFSNSNADKEITSTQYKDYVDAINKFFNGNWDVKSWHYILGKSIIFIKFCWGNCNYRRIFIIGNVSCYYAVYIC